MERNLDILRESTVWFIDQDPTTITLIPCPKSGIGPGGGTVAIAGTPRAPVQVKLIGVEQDGVSPGEGGVSRQFDYTIVAEYGVPIEIDDTFFLGDNKFVILAVLPDNGYEVKAKAKQFSKSPADG